MGLNDPPKTAVRGTRLFPYLAVALHHELRRGPLAHAHRASRVHARGEDSHLRAHAELASAEHPRWRADEPARRADLAREAAWRSEEPGAGRLRPPPAAG